MEKLLTSYSHLYLEAGCDEAGRGCLCGPVVAAAVVVSDALENEFINDSKKLNFKKRENLSAFIQQNAMDYGIATVDVDFIDTHNILRAAIHAMHLALDQLTVRPELIIVDGNRFLPYPFVPHQCIVKGDAKYLSIASASILAKNHRDAIMLELHEEYPEYGWNKNMGYATKVHQEALRKFGPTPHHRKTFRLEY
ncbi:ribonuclease HII [Bergeyella zoohelcum]|uniref:ribonuclease HII n=1 Tax=Bergeyella zoohelcum TaxID=1015 RepID=UPI002A9109C1|nr:ribonuclease HII [Bergeyella zoohelcum]MDY6026321.1 ribonuclease HII [Bergeyella zoohelcum]